MAGTADEMCFSGMGPSRSDDEDDEDEGGEEGEEGEEEEEDDDDDGKSEISTAVPLAPSTFPQFTKLPLELRISIYRHHLHPSSLCAIYGGPELSRTEGPQPFCGPNSGATPLSILGNRKTDPETIKMMNEPGMVRHILYIDQENISHLQHWLAPSPITSFWDITLCVKPYKTDLLDLVQSIHRFIPLFTSARNFELYFETEDRMSSSDLHLDHKPFKQAVRYGFKDTLKALPRIQSFDISYGLSYDYHPSFNHAWLKRDDGRWILVKSKENDATQHARYKDIEMRAFVDEESLRWYQERQRQVDEDVKSKQKVSREVQGLLNAFEKPPGHSRSQ
ncbi:hypothetical protein FKW77_002718 [Venturia effusa]|uniref:Uncharacterized protein n=1 Tax=Venturia effusa TaxID=50376 RepID=A0A517LJU2_9PEZI|nr:hypothetical protein FKW77_002718 [Venturia effusa]